MTLKNGEKFNNSQGLAMTVTEYRSARDVTVKFDKSGYETVSQASHIRRGTVRDCLHPMFFGRGFIGVGKYKTKGAHTKSYSAWRQMMKRCYCPDYHTIKPTYKNVDVCSEWFDYQVFAKWFWDNHQKGSQLDKDILSGRNKIYSPDTCVFVSAFENNSFAHQKTFTMISPCGEEVTFTNMRKFCLENGLSDKNLNAVHSGVRRSHKGWTAKKGKKNE